MTIPTYDEADDRLSAGKATPLDLFIINHEPVGDREAAAFHAHLQKAVDHIAASLRPSPEAIHQMVTYPGQCGRGL